MEVIRMKEGHWKSISNMAVVGAFFLFGQTGIDRDKKRKLYQEEGSWLIVFIK